MLLVLSQRKKIFFFYFLLNESGYESYVYHEDLWWNIFFFGINQMPKNIRRNLIFVIFLLHFKTSSKLLK